MGTDFSMAPTGNFHDKLRFLGYPGTEVARCLELKKKVLEWKAKRRAVILAHSYERPEIHEVADVVGDSLDLSRRAAETKEKIIVFAGVRFMAETAKILSPEKTILLPKPDAGCSLADSVAPKALTDRIRELRVRYPDLAVICYINTTAAVKALADACCTSANAVKVVDAVPSQNILFVPDKNLAAYISGQTDKNIIPWDGSCHVHDEVRAEAIVRAQREYPGAEVLVHPECRPEVAKLADAVLSTEGMLRYAKGSEVNEFIIVTEEGMVDRLVLQLPEKKFHKVPMICRFMKMTQIEDVASSLELMQYEICVMESERLAAEKAVRRMLDLIPDGQANPAGLAE
jgi:quinolinate synthase